jgi:phage terminase large subunit
MTTARVEVPPKLIPVFSPPRGSVRYRGAYGGRGSAKSFTFAKMAAVWGYAEPLRILCTREIQNSIKESFHAELKAAIASEPWLAAHYDVGVDYLRGVNGTEFLFKGLRHSMGGIRSMAKIDLAIVEEAEDVPEESWRQLLPTIRSPNSEIWAIWNPRMDGSPVDNRFLKEPPSNAVVVQMNHTDNPWLPDVLRQEMEDDRQRLDPNTFAHVWEGAYLTNSDAQILSGKWRVERFEPGDDWDGPYHGLDFGFANDPTTANRLWIDGDRLMIEREAHRTGLELDDTAAFVESAIPGISEYPIRADSARPESISYLKRHGLPRITGVKKWQGSVEDGIQHLRSYREIVIHPRCEHTIQEARLYSYKVDRHTGDVLPQPVDANNHHWDDIRYGLQPLIRRKGEPLLGRA